jgi:hypothetical protein
MMSGGLSIATGTAKSNETAGVPGCVMFNALNVAAAEESRQLESPDRWDVSASH